MRWTLVAAAVVVAGAAGELGYSLHQPDSKPLLPAHAALGGLPPSLLNERLLVVYDNDAQVVAPDGALIEDLRSYGASGTPADPVSGTVGTAVFVHAGNAYQFAPSTAGLPEELGPAVVVLPGAGGSFGRVTVPRGATLTDGPFSVVVYVGGGGAQTAVDVPVGNQPVAVMPQGVVVHTGSGALALLGPSGKLSSALTGSTAALDIVGISTTYIAWIAASGCVPEQPEICPLHLTDVVDGSDRVVTPPAGWPGFVGGGSFSPNGQTLSAFAAGASQSAVLPVTIDATTGAVMRAGDPVASGARGPSSSWSSDGRWLFYSSGGVSMEATVPGTDGVGLGPYQIRLPDNSSLSRGSIIGFAAL